MLQTASQETKLQTYLKGGKIAGRAPKPAKLNNLSVFSDKGVKAQ